MSTKIILNENIEFQLTKCKINLRALIHDEKFGYNFTGMVNIIKFIEIIMSLRRMWELLDGVPEYQHYCTNEAMKYRHKT